MLKELQYPFDPNYILTKKKHIKKQLLEKTDPCIDKRIAVLGGFTTNDITLILELFLLNYGIRPVFYESEYNQYYEDAVFPSQELEEFAPDVIYICTSNRNIIRFPCIRDSADTIDKMIAEEMKKYRAVWRNLDKRYGCPVIQNNFEMPFYRLLGNKDASDIHGKVNFITRINMEFYKHAQEHENFFICDLNYISADYGLKKWSDPFYYHMYKYALNVNAIPYLSFNVANIIKSIFGRNKKGIVLDLDNTLWGGVIGDDGVDNIMLGPETPQGQAYAEFQAYLKEHQQMGILLNVNSKNEYENAVLGLDHPDSVLKQDDFSVIKANWEPKDKNLADIAEDLHLLPESMIFVDDNPAERHIIAAGFQGRVSVPALREVQNYIQDIDRNGYFEVTAFTKDDLKRNDMYQENAKRLKMQEEFADYTQYLLSLKMKAMIRPFEPLYMARIAQLTNKSNQFNLTTRRYTQAEIEVMADSAEYLTLYGRLVDKFGDNGVVSIVIGHLDGMECRIDLWIMSCRVLKRDMEYAMMDTFVKYCQNRGIANVRGYYYPTAKNNMVRNFYALQGFSKIAEDEQGNTEWILDIGNGYTKKNQVIDVED